MKPLLNSKYRLEEEIGRGTSGVVYRAIIEDNQNEVAVKIIQEPETMGSGAFEFEYDLLMHLNHPHVLPLIDFGRSDDNHPFWVMPLIHVWDWQKFHETLNPDIAREYVVQVAHALNYLHQANVIHGDLKPENILIEKIRKPPGFHIWLTDFGLAQMTQTGRCNVRGGSFPYMAPESFVRRWLDPRSDLFSFGVVLYELLTGKTLFQSLDEYRRLLNTDSATIKRSYPVLFQPIGKIVDALTVPDPDGRIQSALDILLEISGDTGSAPVRGFITPSTFTGRLSIFDKLNELTSRLALNSSGTSVVIKGPKGSGKTRCLLEWDAWCRIQGLNCSFYTASGGSLMADAKRCFDIHETMDKTSILESRIRDSLGQQSPCIRILDDLDLADPASWNIFFNLIRNAPNGTFFLCCFNDAQSANNDNLIEFTLGELDDLAIRQMIKSRFIPAPPEVLVETIIDFSGSLPGRCSNAIDYFVQSGVVAFERNAWRLKKSPEDIHYDSKTLRLSIVDTLDSESKIATGKLACLGSRIDTALASAILDLDEDFLHKLLKLLVQRQMVSYLSGYPSFSDRGLMQAAMTYINDDVRREIHGKAADYLESHGGDLYACGLHRLEAGQLEKAVSTLLKSASEIFRCGSMDAAISLYDRIQNILDSSGDEALCQLFRARVGSEKGNALVRSGDFNQAIDEYESALNFASSPADRTTIMGNLASLLFRTGQHERSLELMNAAIATAQNADLTSQQGILNAQMGNLLFQQDKLAEAEEAYDRALPFLEARGLDRIASAVWNNIGSIRESGNDLLGAFNAYTRGLPLKRRIGDSLGEAVTRHNMGHILMERGRLRAAVVQLSQACRILEKQGETPHRIQFMGSLALAELYTGHFREALECIKQADPRLHHLENDNLRIWLLSIHASILTACGNPQAALQIMESDIQKVMKSDTFIREFWFFMLRYKQALIACGRVQEALLPEGVLATEQDPVLQCEIWLTASRASLGLQQFEKADDWAMRALKLAGTHRLLLKDCAARLVMAENQLARKRPDRVLAVLTIESLAALEESGALPYLAKWTSLMATSYDRGGQLLKAKEVQAVSDQALAALAVHLPAESDPIRLEAVVKCTSTPMIRAGQVREMAGGSTPSETTMDDRKKLTMLLDISRVLSQETDMNTLLDQIIDYGLEFTGADRGFLYLKPQHESDAVLVTRNISRDAILGHQPQISTTVMHDVLRSGRTIMLNDSLTEEHFSSRRSILAHNLRTIMCAPLMCSRDGTESSSGREPDGVLYVDGTAIGPRFGPLDREIFSALAAHAGIGLSNLLQRTSLTRENKALKQQIQNTFSFDQLIGSSPAMTKLKDLLRKVAPTHAGVLIHGESGTGKELVARTLHYNSPRADGPFLSVNCASLSESILESELFGVEAGVATGVKRRAGLFVQADKGTLFLDEIGDMPLNMQATILRALQERKVRPVGGKLSAEFDVRIICASNKDLWLEVRNGRFREDLFYRLDVITIKLPPLRDRIEDIPVLAHYFLAKHAREMNTNAPAISLQTLQHLAQYPWPGNVRELENQMQRALVLAEPGKTIEPRDLSPRIVDPGNAVQSHIMPSITECHDSGKLDLKTAVSALESDFIAKALATTGGNKAEAARILGLSREGLRLKIQRMQQDTEIPGA